MIQNVFAIFNRNSGEFNTPIVTPLSQKELLNSFKNQIKEFKQAYKPLIYLDMPEDFFIQKVAVYNTEDATFNISMGVPYELSLLVKEL